MVKFIMPSKVQFLSQGAAVQWLRDGLGIIKSAKDTQAMAESLSSNNGLYMVPAFTGLGAPHWDPNARGAIYGITRATGPKDFVRAALESVCYQTNDLLNAMKEDGITLTDLNVDGGMAANDWTMQFLADILNINVTRPTNMETTALGAALLAGPLLRPLQIYAPLRGSLKSRQNLYTEYGRGVAQRFASGLGEGGGENTKLNRLALCLIYTFSLFPRLTWDPMKLYRPSAVRARGEEGN